MIVTLATGGRRSRWQRAVSAAAVGALLLTGCGSRSIAATKSSPPTASATPSSTASLRPGTLLHGPASAVILRATSGAGPGQLRTAAADLHGRLIGDGVTPARVTLTRNGLRVLVEQRNVPAVEALATARGILRFRQVLAFAATTVAAAKLSTQGPLPDSEAASLTPALKAAFERWNCDRTATADPTRGEDNPNDYIIACGSHSAPNKYLLAPADVEGTQVKDASNALGTSGGWQVDLTFDGAGAAAWQRLTARAYRAQPSGLSRPGSCTPPTGCNAVAFVVDGTVMEAPDITAAGGIPGGLAQITDSAASQDSTRQLAAILRAGAFPVPFTVVRTVTSRAQVESVAP